MAAGLEVCSVEADALGAVAELDPPARAAVIERCLRHPSAEQRVTAVAVGAEVLDDATLVAMVRDGADPVRRNGGLEMLKRRGRRALPVAMRLLEDRDADVVLQAMMVVRAVGDGGVRRAMAELLLHENPNVVQAAILALGGGGPQMVPLLLPFLEGDDWLRMAAVEALGDIGGGAAVRALELVLPEPSLEHATARALARCGGSRACRALAARVGAGDGNDPVLWEALAETLEQRETGFPPGEELLALLRRHVAARGEGAARCALRLGVAGLDPVALDVLTAGAMGGSPVPACLRERNDLVPALLQRGGVSREWGLRLAARRPHPALVPGVGAALREAAWRLPPEVVAEAVMALDDAALAPAIIACYAQLPAAARAGWGPVLEHYRPAIAAALPACDPLPGDAGAVLGTLLEDPQAAAAAIVALEPAAQVEAIAAALARPAVLARLPWLEWLGTAPNIYGSLAIVAAAGADLRRDIETIRQLVSTRREPALVRLIAALGDEESVPLLLDLLHGRTTALRIPLLDAIGRIGGPVARLALREVAGGPAGEDRFVYRALAACAEPEDLPLFRAALKHPDWHVRMVCVDALGAMARPEDRVRIAAASADRAPAVAACARKWLTP